MAYSTGTGADHQAFLDAVRTFASGLGWTISKWDTAAKRLYLEKGICHVSLEWYNTNVTTYAGVGASGVVVSEGRIRGSLSQVLGTATDYSTFAGSAIVSGQYNNASAPSVIMGHMEGPGLNWFLFAPASGDYIHAVVQTSANTYAHLGFGIADKGGLAHSGAAYLYADGAPFWYRDNSTTAMSSTLLSYSTPGRASGLFIPNTNRFTHCTFQIYTENALPSGFTNSIACASWAQSATYARTMQMAMPLRDANTLVLPSDYPGAGLGSALLGALVALSANAYSSYVPMFGIPLVITNTTYTLACAVGAIPDLRLINLTGMTPQQELTLSTETWKVFPQLAQVAWAASKTQEAPSSGQFGIAFKKIV